MVACGLYLQSWTDRKLEIPFLRMISLDSKHHHHSASMSSNWAGAAIGTGGVYPATQAMPLAENSWRWDESSPGKSAARNLPETELLWGSCQKKATCRADNRKRNNPLPTIFSFGPQTLPCPHWVLLRNTVQKISAISCNVIESQNVSMLRKWYRISGFP